MTTRRMPLMESPDSNATSSPAPTSTRRSGRVVKAPTRLVPDAPAAGKRKRVAAEDGEDDENVTPELEDDESETEPDDDDDDEDVVEEAPKRKRPAPGAKRQRPAAKRPKTNGTASAAGRFAAIPSRPKQATRVQNARRDGDGDGLYGEIFASSDSTDDIAAQWYQRYKEDDAPAVTDLVNCILQSAGCDQFVTTDDIRDPDNCNNRLAELQAAFTDEGITDYPLIQRTKTSRSFRDSLVSFFKSLIHTLHETESLYKDESLIENIHRWVASMSSSTLRPFRHTATTVALVMVTALVEVAKKLDDRITKLTQSQEAEAKRKKPRQQMLKNIKNDLDEATNNRSNCQDQFKDLFDTVFVHRYRDIDHRIRNECVDALGQWVYHLPSSFLLPDYLRYLGWLLSDAVAQVRHEDLKHLARIFKRDAEKMGHFIDRFRPRVVEMAAQDLDVGVRVVAISVMETLKTKGMLEPNDIDAISKLIFDAEPRVRKAVVDFFADTINDSLDIKVEEMGGNDALDDLFGEDEEDNYDAPRRDWLAIKCLAEQVVAYDKGSEEDGTPAPEPEPPRPLDVAVDVYRRPVVETRISEITHVLCEKINVLRDWEVLAGYLLYDHTVSTKSSSSKGSNEKALRDAVAPSTDEESILLEMFCSAVHQSLAQSTESTHKKKSKTEETENAENIRLRLAGLIPRFLKKFGADPITCKLVLHLMGDPGLKVFSELRQDAETCTRLMDEICIQFSRHIDRNVIAEAVSAMQNARQHEELAELVEAKAAVLWEDLVHSLRNFDKEGELSMRGDRDAEDLTKLADCLMKMSRLASMADFLDILDADGQDEDSGSTVIELVIRIVNRGALRTENEELDDFEDEVVAYAIKTCFFYFLWQMSHIKGLVASGSDIPGDQINALNARRMAYHMNLIGTLSSRAGTDDLRLFAIGGLCDLHVIMGNIQLAVESTPEGEEHYHLLHILYEEIPPALVSSDLLEAYDAAERAFAKRNNKTLAEPADDEDPIDVDDIEDEDEDDITPDEKTRRQIKSENQLLDLAGRMALAISLGKLDATGPQAGRLKKRMLRNVNRLGHQLKTLIGLVDENQIDEVKANKARKRAASRAKSKTATTAAPRGKKVISEEIIEDSSSSEAEEQEEDDDPIEEGTEEDLRRRELLDEPVEPREESDDEELTPVPEGADDDILGDD